MKRSTWWILCRWTGAFRVSGRPASRTNEAVCIFCANPSLYLPMNSVTSAVAPWTLIYTNLITAGVNLSRERIDALRDAGLLDGSGGYAIVSAGEQAGRLEQTLRHHARALNAELDGTYDVLAQWIPVVAYFTVAAVIAGGILG